MGGASSSEGAIPKGMEILAEIKPGYEEILSRDALDFLAKLSRKYSGRVSQLLEQRREQQARFDAGEKPAFLAETKKIREGDWKVAPLPADFQDRRVEITGPTDRKMVINALNSGANVYMPDFEDSNCPTWDNMVQGQINLRDAVRGTVSFEDPHTGKEYALKEGKRAIMVCRPRGWHLWEHHVLVDGQAVPGAIFDFALYFFHNAKQLLANGNGPYFYLPKMQSHLECRLWNEIFVDAQKALGIPNGTIKATCLIETLPAAFEMDEFIYELRDHMAGLNCGRWDYMFSFIKTMRNDPNRVMPDRSFLTMEMPFMRAYTQLVVKTCHKRGCFAMGGMSAVIPIKGDEAANNAVMEKAVMEKVRADKLREVQDGHDGTWVAHPALIPIAKEVFDEHMKTPNQIDRQRDDVQPDAEALLAVPEGPKTEATLRNNINVCILYMAAWIGGTGCVPLHNLMEDAATAEISRAQVWQWVRYGAQLDSGKTVTAELVRQVIEEEVEALQKQLGTDKFAAGEYLDAAFLTKLMCCGRELHDFLTLPAQDIIIAMGK
ncbi:malate synthase A isoform B [Chlorella sorokiniana]|uniref:Malate synthase n=1 Tax=Chlorella sorokiniana TaxID=3076 RepID=A0A2P6U2M8_CHLSO|nr:malate synthase A isoform B [Chlorella sorokiniana]|eukprot:PRW60560.1 malate synthase A isoform B [Chlorella sorokiniana]